MLPLLLSMDSATLINCAKASPNLLRLVCDKEVSRWMLKGIADFTEEKLEELLVVFSTKRSSDMMAEVVKEAASRLVIVEDANAAVERDSAQIRMAIQGWGGTPGIYLVLADHLEELTWVTKTV